MKKKVISSMLAVSMLAVTLFGCGSQPGSGEATGSAGGGESQPVQSSDTAGETTAREGRRRPASTRPPTAPRCLTM